MSDYYSNFIEVARINTITSRAVIKELKAVFARFGIPDTLITDNGPQFSAAKFSVFAKTWMFGHKTSSPTYPQSNGKAESAVQTVKRFSAKCKSSGGSEFQRLLDWRNTPTADIGSSPAQCLFGRRCKTLLHVAGSLLQPSYPTEEDTRKMIEAKQRQQHYYIRQSKPLEPLAEGDSVRMKLPSQGIWTPRICTGQQGPRSYHITTDRGTFRRKRRQLIITAEPHEADPVPVEVPSENDEQQPDELSTPPQNMQ